MKHRLPTLLAALLLMPASVCLAGQPPWPGDSYAGRLIEEVLPETGPTFDGQAFAQRGSRSATYIALGLLWRDGPHDRPTAAAILSGVVDLQYDDPPGAKLHGIWRTRANETKVDANWREFVGCGLIHILETFPDRLPEPLVRDIRAALVRAADGAAQRDVGAGYTNIALMSALLMDCVGAVEGRDELRRTGQAKAEAIYDLFARHKTFDEYNSPTYYGADLMALALWRKHARCERMRELGRSMEADLWRDVGAFYHAGMRNLCGPFVRAYGMDMMQYCALTGLWIALAVDDPALAPWPGPGGRHGGERTYAPVFALLGVEVPPDVLPRLRRFTEPRSFERTFRDTKATVRMEKDLMMGAAAMPRRWEQHHPATIYWQPKPGGSVGWVLLAGMNDRVAPAVVGRSLQVARPKRSDVPIEFLITAPGLTETAITPQRWNLPGLTVDVSTADGVVLDHVRWVDHQLDGRCLEVAYRVPGASAEGAPVVTLTPRPTASSP